MILLYYFFGHSVFLSYSTLNNITTLKSGLEVTQGHRKCYHSIGTLSYLHSIVTVAPVLYFELKRDIGRKSRFFHNPCIRRPR